MLARHVGLCSTRHLDTPIVSASSGVQAVAGRRSGSFSARPPHLRAVRTHVASPKAPAPARTSSTLTKPSSLFATQSADEEESMDDGNNCRVFTDRDGQLVECMCCDYGYRSGVGRLYDQMDGSIPKGGLALALDNFREEWGCIRRAVRHDEFAQISAANPATTLPAKALYALGGAVVKGLAALDSRLEGAGLLDPVAPQPLGQDALDPVTGQLRKECCEIREKLSQLVLSNEAVWAREHRREAAGEGVQGTPWYVRGVYLALCGFLDAFYCKRPIARFWFLETVARMPYFTYISCLHLYESLGWWRAAAELRKIHFAEEWNELHHLQIMETLGGDMLWLDRFLGYHAAVAYYWILVGLFIISPQVAYNFSELLEAHAVDTYGEFADVNEAMLKTIPPPLVALQYYRGSDLYMFDEMSTGQQAGRRSPPTKNLYDTFINIRDDEGEHVKTMKACQDNSVVGQLAARRDQPRRL